MVRHTRMRKHNKKRSTQRRYKKRGGYDIQNSGNAISISPVTSSPSATPSPPVTHTSSVSSGTKPSILHHIRNAGTHAENIAKKATDTFKNILSMVTPDIKEDKEIFESHEQHRETPSTLIGGRRTRKHTNKRSKTRRNKHSKKRSKTRRRR